MKASKTVKPKRRHIILGNLLLTILLMGGATWAWADGGELTQPLPEGVVDMAVVTSTDSYFNTTLSNAGDLNGTYEGWCVDLEHFILTDETYKATMTSSCEEAAKDLVDKPDNLDLVNYILNQDYVGTQSSGGQGGTYTVDDVQWAIWTLIDDLSPPFPGSGDQDRVDEIVADALANGEGFKPGCGEQLAVILNPVDSDGNAAQVTIIGLDASCDSDGDGVEGNQDVCPATIIPESVPTEELKPNHWALVDGDFVFDTVVPSDKGQGSDRHYTTLDTAGCSCEQIIARLGLGEGPTKNGCPNGVMDKWVKEVNQN